MGIIDTQIDDLMLQGNVDAFREIKCKVRETYDLILGREPSISKDEEGNFIDIEKILRVQFVRDLKIKHPHPYSQA